MTSIPKYIDISARKMTSIPKYIDISAGNLWWHPYLNISIYLQGRWPPYLNISIYLQEIYDDLHTKFHPTVASASSAITIQVKVKENFGVTAMLVLYIKKTSCILFEAMSLHSIVPDSIQWCRCRWHNGHIIFSERSKS
jgi:hypothetical protein